MVRPGRGLAGRSPLCTLPPPMERGLGVGTPRARARASERALAAAPPPRAAGARGSPFGPPAGCPGGASRPCLGGYVRPRPAQLWSGPRWRRPEAAGAPVSGPARRALLIGVPYFFLSLAGGGGPPASRVRTRAHTGLTQPPTPTALDAQPRAHPAPGGPCPPSWRTRPARHAQHKLTPSRSARSFPLPLPLSPLLPGAQAAAVQGGQGPRGHVLLQGQEEGSCVWEGGDVTGAGSSKGTGAPLSPPRADLAAACLSPPPALSHLPPSPPAAPPHHPHPPLRNGPRAR